MGKFMEQIYYIDFYILYKWLNKFAVGMRFSLTREKNQPTQRDREK